MVKDFEIAEIVGNNKVAFTVNGETVGAIAAGWKNLDFHNDPITNAKPAVEHYLAQTLNPNKETLRQEAAAAISSPGAEFTQGVEGINNVAQRTGGKGAYIG